MVYMSNNVSVVTAIQKMIQDIDSVADKAAYQLQLQVKKDFDKASESIVDEYYKYPVKYHREYNLYDIYNVKSNLKRHGHIYTITTEIELNSDILNGIYYSHSKKHHGSGSWSDGGQVEGDYVFTNFMEGAHPWTQFNNGDYIYGVEIGGTIPHKDFKKYVKDYGPKYFETHIQQVMGDILKKYI